MRVLLCRPMPAPNANAQLLADADLCVKCGLCLPACPTYRDQRSEADSPRGRIALVQALAGGTIAATPKLEAHLDGCLSCGACERACPAQVPYGRILDAGRARLAELRPARLRGIRLVSLVLRTAALRRLLGWLLLAYQRSGLQRLARASLFRGGSALARLEAKLSMLDVNRALALPPVATPSATVELFIGCVGDLAERAVALDLAKLLAACGVQARLSAAQTCCGALDQHGGRPALALELAARNRAAFAHSENPILPLATGCAATLRDDPALVRRLRDPLDYLLEAGAQLRFVASEETVAVHVPCTQRNVIGRGAALKTLLARVPGLRVVELETKSGCCGAAGLHFVTELDAADRLLQPKLDAARALAPDRILSANIGCSLHLAAGLRREGLTAPVEHPLRLLARQLAP